MSDIEMTCEEALRLLALYLDLELEQPQGARVHEHLQRCKSCFSRAEFERALKAQLATLRSTEVSSGLAQRVRGVLYNFDKS